MVVSVFFNDTATTETVLAVNKMSQRDRLFGSNRIHIVFIYFIGIR